MDRDAGDPRVAVVMITHNRSQEALRSLGHLARLPEKPRIVLVDNGSNDRTSEAVAGAFPSVEVVRSETNLGSSGRTVGVRRVDAPYVAFCDDDTWWEPGSLSRVADLFDAHPRLGVLTARILVGPGEAEDPICEELARSPLPREPGMPGPPLLGFLAGASAIRRSAFLEAGGFGDRVHIGGEEEWLAVELASRDWWICYVPELLVHHYPSILRDPRARRSHKVRNALWFAWLRRPLSSALRRTIRLARTSPWDGATLRGFAAAFAGLPLRLHDRHVVPDQVECGLRLLDDLVRSKP